MRSIGYVSRFAPFIKESVKIGLIKEKMKQLKEELKHELDEHHIAEHTEQSLGEKSDQSYKEKRDSFKGMKDYLSQ